MQFSNYTSYLKKAWSILPWIIIAVLCYDLFTKEDLYFSLDYLSEFTLNLKAASLILSVLLLMFFNWWLESVKWRQLTKQYYSIDKLNAFKAVWAGVSTSFITPNRIGDFIGKISFLPKKLRKTGLMSSAYGSFAQWFITLFMGIVAFAIYGHTMLNDYSHFSWILITASSIWILLAYLFFQKDVSVLFRNRWSHLRNARPGRKKKAIILGLSFTRYLVFTFQFYLLLLLFGEELSFMLVFTKLAYMYLFLAFIPASFLGEIGLKESIAVWVFSGVLINSLIIISATFILWMINLLIPALIGNFFLMQKTRN